MLTREIQPPQANPIQHGKPVQGTWTRPFECVNFTGRRVKEWQSFIIQNENIFFEAIIANLKFIRFIEITFFEKQNPASEACKEKHYFDSFPFVFWELPNSLFNTTMEYKTLGYSINVHNNLDENKFEFLFEIDPLNEIGGFNAHFIVDVGRRLPFVTNLLFSDEHCVSSYKAIGSASGNLNANFTRNDSEENKPNLLSQDTLALVRDCKGYFPFVTRIKNANGFGFDNLGNVIAFSLCESPVRGANKNNENVFWFDNSITPLPPVHITHEEGLENTWIIEDVEGMIDLSFTPQNQKYKKSFNIVLSKAELANPKGVFNGMIMTKTGQKIDIHNIPGCCENLYLRM